jgi:hypothetical protein
MNFIYPNPRVALPTLPRTGERAPLKRAASPRARRQSSVNEASGLHTPGRDGAVPVPGLMRRLLPCRTYRWISVASGRGPWSVTSSRCMPLTLLWVDRFSSLVPGSTACATEMRIGRSSSTAYVSSRVVWIEFPSHEWIERSSITYVLSARGTLGELVLFVRRPEMVLDYGRIHGCCAIFLLLMCYNGAQPGYSRLLFPFLC